MASSSVENSTIELEPDAPDPIPLRTLIVLLNYERMATDPRFKDVSLKKSSVADPILTARARNHCPEQFAEEPRTVQKANFHFFEPSPGLPASSQVDAPSTICSIHPEADPTINNMTRAQLELIYYETRDHRAYNDSMRMFEVFFELYCPNTGQRVSFQIAAEEPVILDYTERHIRFFHISGPKQSTIAYVNTQPPNSMMTGRRDEETHKVLVFRNPITNVALLVDAARMQFGEAARGPYGENYFIGSYPAFMRSMKNICAEAKDYRKVARLGEGNDHFTELRIRQCVVNAMDRWQNRNNEDWCNFCGKEGPNMLKCCIRYTIQVGYCCEEHQGYDSALHVLACNKNQNPLPDFLNRILN